MMAEFKLGYKHYPKDLAKFKPVDKDDDLTNLRFVAMIHLLK